jgi:hypothetical protein
MLHEIILYSATCIKKCGSSTDIPMLTISATRTYCVPFVLFRAAIMAMVVLATVMMKMPN